MSMQMKRRSSVSVIREKLMHYLMYRVGAAFYGASISSQFKTKSIKVQDMTPYDVQVSYIAESKLSGMSVFVKARIIFECISILAVSPRTISTLVFPAGSKYGSKKTLTLKRKEDFTLTLSYKSPQKG